MAFILIKTLNEKMRNVEILNEIYVKGEFIQALMKEK